jgi:hypothetical protein
MAGDNRLSPAATVRIASVSLAGANVLEQEPACAGCECLVDVLVCVEGCEDEDARSVEVGKQASGCGESVENWHADVHEHDVGPKRSRTLDRSTAVGGLPDDLDVRFALDDRAEAVAHEGLVVGEQDADHARSLSNGSVATTWNPPSSFGPAFSAPP